MHSYSSCPFLCTFEPLHSKLLTGWVLDNLKQDDYHVHYWMCTYFFFLKSKLNTRQTAAYTSPATAAIEYRTTRAIWLRCNVICVAPSYGTPPVIVGFRQKMFIRSEN